MGHPVFPTHLLGRRRFRGVGVHVLAAGVEAASGAVGRREGLVAGTRVQPGQLPLEALRPLEAGRLLRLRLRLFLHGFLKEE